LSRVTRLGVGVVRSTLTVVRGVMSC
jgi:hypothetical protein